MCFYYIILVSIVYCFTGMFLENHYTLVPAAWSFFGYLFGVANGMIYLSTNEK
jgi:hypothetical protein